MFNNTRNLLAIVFVVLQFGALSVSAVVGCAAEANFQGCKSIQTSLLNGCGPVDYSCQCNAQHLIQQCYNLCPEYSVDANEQARVAAGICAAVPTTSAPLLPSGSSVPVQTWFPSSTVAASAPSSSQSVTTSFGIQISPSSAYMCALVFLVGLLQL